MALYHQLWNQILDAADEGKDTIKLKLPDHEYATWFHNELKQSGISSYTSQSEGIYYINVLLC